MTNTNTEQEQFPGQFAAIKAMDDQAQTIIDNDPKLKAIWDSVEIGYRVTSGKQFGQPIEGVVTRKSGGTITIQTGPENWNHISRVGRLIKNIKVVGE